MDLEMKLSGCFFKIHTAEAPTRAGGLPPKAAEGAASPGTSGGRSREGDSRCKNRLSARGTGLRSTTEGAARRKGLKEYP